MGISIRIVMVGIMLVVALVTALVIMLPVESAGRSAADDGAQLLRAEIVDKQRLSISAFFELPQKTISALIDAGFRGDYNHNNPTSFMRQMIHATLTMGITPYLTAENGMSVFIQDAPLVNGSYDFTAFSLTLPCTNATGHPINNGLLYSYTAYPNSTINYNFGGLPVANFCFDGRVRPWYAPLFAKQAWTNVYVNFNSNTTSVTAGGPVYSVTEGRVVGAFGADFETGRVSRYVRSEKLAKTGKMIVLDAAQRKVLAAGWDELPTVNLTGQFEMKNVSNMGGEPMLTTVIGELGDQWAYDCGARCSATVGKGRDRIFVDAVSITDAYGLNLKLLVMIPERDFKDDLWTQTDIAIGVSVAAVVVMMGISVLVIMAVLSPLKRVEERLYQSATLEDIEEEEEQSIFTEVANIQEAYTSMTKELRRVRSYVPQSLLKTLDGEEDEDDEMSEATGSASNTRGSSSRRQSEFDRGSSRSRASTGSKASKAALVAGRALKTDLGVVGRRCTVLAANLRGFHSFAKNKTPSEMVVYHTKALEVFANIVATEKGVVDSFSGDHFIATFGAVNNIASHATRAGSVAVALQSELKSVRDFGGATIGIATGQTLCGNMGTSTIRRFSIVGGIVNQAFVLEALCKFYNMPTLVNYTAYESLQFEHHLAFVDIVKLPFAKSASPIGALLGAKKGAAADEWMYVLQQQEGSSGGFTAQNDAYMSAARGDFDDAASGLSALKDDAPGVKRLKEIVNERPDMNSLTAKTFGAFYSNCMIRPEGGMMQTGTAVDPL